MQTTPMSEATIVAIEKSKAHWERMRDGKEEPKEVPNARCCELCRVFGYWLTYSNRACTTTNGEKCPVFERTGMALCYMTPYLQAYNFWEDRRNDIDSWAKWQIAAQYEINFLESLLPK